MDSNLAMDLEGTLDSDLWETMARSIIGFISYDFEVYLEALSPQNRSSGRQKFRN